ncbi:PAS domain-containing sensor histidine kinase [Rivularia sp. UHCC 0363]|uniref:PAS domain-containing sensor histidine kinase n=1 Tax=Rivularia sp. UHCC 0363 TaxID=3110244 RepID=UPI002B1ECE96|nr:PAS domain-containing sensor histidine kinase [Rivularia sp. UHCC 0363]MEA5598650.1 PAS domain-containing sensor histidine kinase [Rivularia sp. UHCC 0363]
MHSQLIKFAHVLVSPVVIAIFVLTGWLVTQDEKFIFSDSTIAIATEGLVAIAIFAILIWKGTKVIENACNQRDKAINALKDNEVKLKSFLDTNFIGIVELNTDGNIYVANEEFLRITGYNHSCLQNGNLNWFNITPLEYLDVDKENFSQARAFGSCKSYEKELICASGKKVKVKVGCTCITQKAKPDKYIINLSECKNEDRLDLLFETTNDLISSEQPEELIKLLYNEIAETLTIDCYLYYSVDKNSRKIELTSHTGISCSQTKDLECFEFGQGICGTVAQNRIPIKIENVLISNDPNTESIRNLGISAYYSCPLIAQGQLLGIISFGSRSVSDFTTYEINIMQSVCNQIAIAIQRVNLMNSLQQANRVKDEFLGILSHELRSPLNSILGWAQYLRVRKLDESTTSRALESIERNSRELHHLIEELLDMSRTIQGKMQLSIRDCNLAAIIVGVIENLRSASVAKQIEIKLSVRKGFGMDEDRKNAAFTDYEEPLIKLAPNKIPASHEAMLENQNFLIAGDDERLKQVMWNLLSNAIKFTSCGGCIEVSLLEEKANETSLSYAVIQVSDTGIGIDAEFLPYVFDRFRQGDSSNARAHNGLGLGLAIVRHIVELHGGSISVESPGVGKGATFIVKLPLIASNELPSVKKNPKNQFVMIN